MGELQRMALLPGRVLLSAIFIMSGLGKIPNWGGTVEYMESKGMVAIPLFLAGAIVFEVVGGLSILIGYRARMGALMLIVFIIPAAVIFHNFWALEGAEAENQMIHFMKNMAILGGLLIVFANGAGPYSLDARTKSDTSA